MSTCSASSATSTSFSSAWSATARRCRGCIGPLITRPIDRKVDHSRRLSGSNYERGIDIVNRFRCKEAYVYAMGMEPWLKYIMAKDYTPESDPIIASNRLIEDCRSRGHRRRATVRRKGDLHRPYNQRRNVRMSPGGHHV